MFENPGKVFQLCTVLRITTGILEKIKNSDDSKNKTGKS